MILRSFLILNIEILIYFLYFWNSGFSKEFEMNNLILEIIFLNIEIIVLVLKSSLKSNNNLSIATKNK